jgi:hypothetical protein
MRAALSSVCLPNGYDTDEHHDCGEDNIADGDWIPCI